MPRLSQAEIRNNALSFAQEWKDETSERAESQTFWNEFFEIFGLRRRNVAVFERAVRWEQGATGKIDLFWKGVVLAESKSAGQDLDKATSQAFRYLESIPDGEMPQFVLISDFARFRLYDLESGAEYSFPLSQLPDRIQLFGFISGYQRREFKEQDPVNIQAAQKLGALHDALEAAGYTGHPLEVFLVRLVYCLFADDTHIFEPRGSFLNFLNDKTAPDGSNTGAMLGLLFQVLDTPDANRLATLDEDLRGFQYVNGALFRERIDMPFFDARMRRLLIEACETDWGKVSPAVFGSLFQSVMEPRERRALGAHYTSEKNILKVVHGLFLDELLAEFESVKNNLGKLRQFHDKLATLRFFDPACGCGNFLVITYREMRRLELEVLKQIRSLTGDTRGQLYVTKLSKLSVDQYYGIEIEEFPAEIARVALWVTDHLANLELSSEFGIAQFELPLEHTPNIVYGNALRLDWREVVGEPDDRLFVLGNPPFVGGKMMDDAQRADMAFVCGDVPNYGLLDLVCGWYVKAAKFLSVEASPIDVRKSSAFPEDAPDGLAAMPPDGGTASKNLVRSDGEAELRRTSSGTAARTQVAFVSTNSITQGEQVGVLWSYLLQQRIRINFAHRTFKWTNEAPGRAAVFCVIIGFGHEEATNKRIFDYESPTAEPNEYLAEKISPYLIDSDNTLMTRRSNPLSSVPEARIGNKPIDDGNYLFSDAQRQDFLRLEPKAARYFRPWLGAEEFINGFHRWCMWLGDAEPQDLRLMPRVLQRIDAVRNYRLNSKSASTRKLATIPTRFHVENFPKGEYLVIPEVSSERRVYIPVGFLDPTVLVSNKLRVVPDASLYHFGVLTSIMHNAWTRVVSGRLENRYQYSISVVYNNFPWPRDISDRHRERIGTTAQGILDARAKYPGSTMADLYDPNTMPPDLVAAHRANDEAVDAAYGKRGFRNELERLEFLFDLYRQYTEPLGLADRSPRPRRRRSTKE